MRAPEWAIVRPASLAVFSAALQRGLEAALRGLDDGVEVEEQREDELDGADGEPAGEALRRAGDVTVPALREVLADPQRHLHRRDAEHRHRDELHDRRQRGRDRPSREDLGDHEDGQRGDRPGEDRGPVAREPVADALDHLAAEVRRALPHGQRSELLDSGKLLGPACWVDASVGHFGPGSDASILSSSRSFCCSSVSSRPGLGSGAPSVAGAAVSSDGPIVVPAPSPDASSSVSCCSSAVPAIAPACAAARVRDGSLLAPNSIEPPSWRSSAATSSGIELHRHPLIDDHVPVACRPPRQGFGVSGRDVAGLGRGRDGRGGVARRAELERERLREILADELLGDLAEEVAGHLRRRLDEVADALHDLDQPEGEEP